MHSDATGGSLCAAVAGQPLARSFFARALASGRLSHAYLFVGPEGVGKRRFADELARALTCVQPDGVAACGRCVFCRMPRPDAIVLAPVDRSTIAIDQIRAIGEALSLTSDRRRVVIVDPADAMPVESANAMLKTLEEPPPRSHFILVTSRPAQLLDTIHSRCHRVPFHGLAPADFESALSGLYMGLDGESNSGTEASCEIDDDLRSVIDDIFRQISRDELHAITGGSPGVAKRLILGIAECGGVARYGDLLAGRGSERPESLIDYVPERATESRRDRTRRLVELVVAGTWGKRSRDAGTRQYLAERCFEFDELLQQIDGNANSTLVLERLARLLSSR